MSYSSFLTHLFRAAIKCAIIAAFCIRAAFHQSPPLARLITHLFPSSPCLFFISLFLSIFFFYSKAADERSRWFVLWLVSAPLSPLSDHLHLLPSIQRHSAVESRVCAYTLDCNTCQKTGSVQNMPLLRFQLKRISE